MKIETLKKNSSGVYALETPKEKGVRIAITVVVALIILKIGGAMLPSITQDIHTFIDFGIASLQLIVIIAVLGLLWLTRSFLFAKYKALARRISRAIVRTDLPTFLELVVENRRNILAKFGLDVTKMKSALNQHQEDMNARLKSMEENLEYAANEKKKENNVTSLSEQERQIAADNRKHYSKEAQMDKETLEAMQKDKERMLKTYYFFDRLRNNLTNDTESLTNKIVRMRQQLKTSGIWKDAAQGATQLLGVTGPFEEMTLEETRNQIAENEAAVMNMISDHESLLLKMEAKQEVMDEKGQMLLEQYSNKVDVVEFMRSSVAETSNGSVASMTSLTDKYKDLFPVSGK